MEQKVKTILLPELGLELTPEFVHSTTIDTKFSRTVSHIAGQTGTRSIMIKATSGGRLETASAGVPFEWMDVETDNAPDAWNAAQTYEYVEPILLTDIDIENFAAEIQFRNQAGVWLDERRLRVGVASIGFIHYGIRIRNRVALSVAAFQIVVYR